MANQKTKAAAVPKPRTTRSDAAQTEASSSRRNRSILIMFVLIAMSVSFSVGFFWNHLAPHFPPLSQPIPAELSPPITTPPDLNILEKRPTEPSTIKLEKLNPEERNLGPKQEVPIADPPAQESMQEPAPEQENSPAMMEIKTALASLRTDFETLSTDFEILSTDFEILNTTIITLTERLDTIETVLENRPAEAEITKDWSVLITIGHIRQSLQNGRPYAADLALLTPMLAGDSAALHFLETLRPYAESGVPSRSELSRQFTAQAALWAESPETKTTDQQTGMWDETMQRLKALVRIRRMGEQTGNTPEARVARAENHLNADDLAAAGTELLLIPTAQVWAQHAIGRAKAEKALHDLTARIMDQQ